MQSEDLSMNYPHYCNNHIFSIKLSAYVDEIVPIKVVKVILKIEEKQM